MKLSEVMFYILQIDFKNVSESIQNLRAIHSYSILPLLAVQYLQVYEKKDTEYNSIMHLSKLRNIHNFLEEEMKPQSDTEVRGIP